jgi:hypothetical protein
MRLQHVFVSLIVALPGLGAGFAFASGTVPAVLISDNPQRYDQWIATAISKLSGDDEHEQSWAADQLGLAVPDATVRSKVLAALEPHLNGSNKPFRQSCVKA